MWSHACCTLLPLQISSVQEYQICGKYHNNSLIVIVDATTSTWNLWCKHTNISFIFYVHNDLSKSFTCSRWIRAQIPRLGLSWRKYILLWVYVSSLLQVGGTHSYGCMLPFSYKLVGPTVGGSHQLWEERNIHP